MIRYLTTKLFSAFIVIFGVLTLVFFLIHLVPGDPVEVMLGESASVADRAQLRETLGLDQSLLAQWASYIKRVVQLDFGRSIHSQRKISEILFEHIPITLLLTASALLVAVLVAFPLGILASLYKGRSIDHGAMLVSLTGVSIPNFVAGPLLILLFSVYLGWLPVSGYDSPAGVILPALTLGTAMAAILSRMIRASMLEVLNEDYIRTARAKGLKPRSIIWRHGLRNALLPVVTLLGLQLGALLGGAVITEVIFALPGIGQLLIESIQKRDYPLVQACVLLISMMYVVVNTATDMLYTWLDPRIRFASH